MTIVPNIANLPAASPDTLRYAHIHAMLDYIPMTRSALTRITSPLAWDDPIYNANYRDLHDPCLSMSDYRVREALIDGYDATELATLMCHHDDAPDLFPDTLHRVCRILHAMLND